ncbi:MAG: fatty acid desaturase, partial [Oceanospirillaceae bacterium]|nr:fatty acid desaturase [Oceanospirillaceae bacterium]
MTQTDTGAQVLRKIKNDLIKRYAVRNNRIALIQTLSTLLPVIALTYAGIAALDVSMLLASGIVLLLTLFLLRAFVMLHDCGHNCLYESPRA